MTALCDTDKETQMVKKLAKIKSTFLGFEDHGFFTAILHVEYGKGEGAQGIGLLALGAEAEHDTFNPKRSHDIRPTKGGCEWVMRMLEVCGVRQWERLPGRTIQVLFNEGDEFGMPIGIENLPTESGRQFLFADFEMRSKYEWAIEKKLIRDATVDMTKWLAGWGHEQ